MALLKTRLYAVLDRKSCIIMEAAEDKSQSVSSVKYLLPCYSIVVKVKQTPASPWYYFYLRSEDLLSQILQYGYIRMLLYWVSINRVFIFYFVANLFV